MAKRLLHQLRIRTTAPSRKRGKRKQVISAVTEASGTVTDFNRPSQPDPTPPAKKQDREHPKTRSPRWGRFWRWSLVWLSAILILGGTGIVGALLLTTVPPPPDCDRMSPIATDSERLYCASLAAQSGKLDQLVAAMNLVSSWQENHPLYPEAQKKMDEWSQALLTIARQRINQGNLQAAIAIVRKIPVTSPFYPESQAKITDWQQDWKRGEQIANSVLNAMKAQNWVTASKNAQGLLQMNMDYWRQQRFDELMKQLELEQQAWQQLQEARNLAQANNPTDLDQAIALAGKVNHKTLARVQAQADRDKWSRALVQIAAERFKQGDYAGVVVVLQRIPPDSFVYEEAQDWIRFGRAQYATNGHDNILAFLDALSAARQISPKSPLYPQARERISLWQSHLQDQIQLEFANALANFNQPLTFQLAINQARLVGPKRPGRIQAQTLIAYWRKEIQNISDRAALAEARQLAKPGTIDSLRVAVAKAAQVPPGQPLRIEAQTAIAQWTGQIQTIEDQPILDRAQALAQQGNLVAAVAAAREIRPDRALYSKAQTVANNWVAQIQIAQDQPILDAATELAAQGNLSAAIQKAAQVGAGRPLYGEAQNAIARWQSQLDAAQTGAEQPQPQPSQPTDGGGEQHQQTENKQAEHQPTESNQAQHQQTIARSIRRHRGVRYREELPVDTN